MTCSWNSAPVLLSSAAMREADRRTIEDLGVPGFTLMETAGRGAAAFVPEGARRVAVVCGRGNNGGDGLVVARTLAERGRAVHVFMVGGTERLSADAARNAAILDRLRALGAPVTIHAQAGAPSQDALGACDFVVDALLGTGLSAAPRAPFDAAIDAVNRHAGPVLSIDVPSGLDANAGFVHGSVVQAAVTVTMGALKTGLVLGDGPGCAGDVHVVPIGIPDAVIQDLVAEPGCARRTDDLSVRHLLPRPTHRDHKYTHGPVLVIGGSQKYPGAPVLAARAAARIGSGYVVAAVPVGTPTEGFPVEIPVERVAAAPDGTLGGSRVASELADWLQRARAVVIGPGVGRSTSVEEAVEAVLAAYDGPVVVDADGLRALAARPGWERRGNAQRILTPHAGEFAAMAAEPLDPAVSRVDVAQLWADAWQCVLLLKGLPSVVAAPDGERIVCGTGNPVLASAGTGDVLAGMCAGLLAQGLSPFDAAAAAVHIGGAAADRFAARCGRSSMMASDLLRELPATLRERFQ